jgi:hypothetical protein
MKERMELVQSMQEYVGKYFSEQYIMDNVLRFSTTEQSRIRREIDIEKESGGEKDTEEPPA